MSQEIFKICNLKDNKINRMDIFNGNTEYINQNISNLYSSNPNIFNNILTEDEVKFVLENNVEVYFHNNFIYIDDSIETIKKKLIEVTNSIFEQMYLFYDYNSTINSLRLYNTLTRDKLILNKLAMVDFLSNINQPELISQLPDKDDFTYDDILELDLNDKEFKISQPLGQLITSENDIYPICVNPFNISKLGNVEYLKEIVKTNIKSLLLSNNVKKIINNVIYNCNALDTLNYLKAKDISEEDVIKLYYPYLNKLDINNILKIKESNISLLSKSKELVDKTFIRNNNNVSLFYDIFKERKDDFNYKNKGIISIEFDIEPEYKYNIPLNTIFKIIHASKEIPLIKYNPSKKMENIYRLYADKISTKGSKIPYLNKTKIFKLIKTIGKSQSVSTYSEITFEDSLIPIVCKFNANGSINIFIELNKAVEKETLNKIIKQTVNPIIEKINIKLKQNGYSLPIFLTLDDNKINIIDLQYTLSIDLKKSIDTTNIIGCISSIFNVEQTNLKKKGIIMRFKRVSNFSEMDSSEAYILELRKRELEPEEIIERLVENFDLTEYQAKTRVAEVLRADELVKTLSKSKQIRNKGNPGFLTQIKLQEFVNLVNIRVSGINNINYLSTVPIYLDSLLRITQNPESTNVPVEKINSLCIKEEIKDTNIIDDIVKDPIKEPEPEVDIQPIELKQEEDDEDDDDFQDTFFGSDEEDDTDSDQDGGADDFESDNSYTSQDIEIIELQEDVKELSNELSQLKEKELEKLKQADSDSEEDPDLPDLEEDPDLVALNQKEESKDSDIESVDDLVLTEDEEENSEPVKSEPVKSEPVKPKPIVFKKVGFKETPEKKSDLPEKKLLEEEKPITPIKLTVKSKPKTEGKALNQDITGMSLSNPNPFEDRLKKRAPKLFEYDLKGKYSGYNRICPSNVRRQPVILTDEEKEKIDREHPGSYNEAINYGIPGGEKFWYICPRYWSLKDNTSLTEEDVKSGKYGNLSDKTPCTP